MTNDVQSQLESIAALELLLQFDSFDQTTAVALGQAILKTAQERSLPVIIDVRKGDDCLFFAALPGTTPANADWARRKRNLVNLEQSSYAIGLQGKAGNDVVAIMALDPRDYTAHGGCFPIRVRGTGMVGTVTVSGLPQKEDHSLVVETLGQILGLSPETI
jgi:uncharacterized protein (UPF0303 family)